MPCDRRCPGDLRALHTLVGRTRAKGDGRRTVAAGAIKNVERANAVAVARHSRVEADVARTPAQARRDELKRWAPVVLVCLLLGGCATVPTGGPGRGGAWCDVERPTRLSPERVDAMTDDGVKAAVAHYRHGQAECGWPPGRKSSSPRASASARS